MRPEVRMRRFSPAIARVAMPHVIFGQLVGVQKFEALTGFADIGAPAFVEAEDS